MKLRIFHGYPERNALLQTAGAYFAKKLRLGRVSVTLKLESGLQKNEKCRGMAFQDSPTRYTIKLERSLKQRAMLRCFAHELVHVKQWVSGIMEDLTQGRYRVRWHSKTYRPNKLAYRRHPWERHAYRMELQLFRSFTQFFRTGY